MAERDYLVLSAIGPDQPGLVAALTAWIKERGGNVEDSRMAVLGGSFGIMMLLAVSDEARQRIEDTAVGVEAETGLRVHLVGTTPPRSAAGQQRYAVAVEGADHEGIVHAVAEALHRMGGNIVSLESSLYPAPVSGSPLFRLSIVADLPDLVAVAELDRALEDVAAAENLDISATPVG